MFPWWLYSLTPRDQSQPVLRLWNQFLTAIATNVIVSASLTVPQEYVALITGYSFDCVGAGAATPTQTLMEITAGGTPNGPGDLSFSQEHSTGDSAVHRGFTRAIYVAAAPGALINFSSTFSGATGANLMSASIAGVLIPRGTIQVV